MNNDSFTEGRVVQLLLTMIGPIGPGKEYDPDSMEFFGKFVEDASNKGLNLVEEAIGESTNMHVAGAWIHADTESTEPSYYVYVVTAVHNKLALPDHIMNLSGLLQKIFVMADSHGIIRSTRDDDDFSLFTWDVHRGMALQIRFWLEHAVTHNINPEEIHEWKEKKESIDGYDSNGIKNPLNREIMSFVMENKNLFDETLRKDYDILKKNNLMSEEQLEGAYKKMMQANEQWLSLVLADEPTQAVHSLLKDLNIEVK